VDNPDQAILSPITVTASASLLDELLSPKSVSIYSKEDIKKAPPTRGSPAANNLSAGGAK